MIERADKTSRILDVKYFILLPKPTDVGTPYDDIQWPALLRSASALEMYRQRHGRISPANVVKFLVLDREFPRAVLHCLTQANESLHAISGTPPGSFCQLGRAAAGPAAGRAGVHPGRRSHRQRPARIRRRLPAAAQQRRRGDLRIVLRQAAAGNDEHPATDPISALTISGRRKRPVRTNSLRHLSLSSSPTTRTCHAVHNRPYDGVSIHATGFL